MRHFVVLRSARIFSKQCDNYRTQIDIHSLPQGSYIIKIHTDKGDTTRTIIKE
ncbi:MAG: T9SS type A sorting domain-containing protein [Bacteroidales bacterium]|nr:T9SS type A sorting domain-containing protein [Bacteroidales bacterium]